VLVNMPDLIAQLIFREGLPKCSCWETSDFAKIIVSPEIIAFENLGKTIKFFSKHISLTESTSVSHMLDKTWFYRAMYVSRLDECNTIERTKIISDKEITVDYHSLIVFRKIKGTPLTYEVDPALVQNVYDSPLSDLILLSNTFTSVKSSAKDEFISVTGSDNWIIGDVHITHSDRLELVSDKWLNDKIIEAYMKSVLPLEARKIAFCSSHVCVKMGRSLSVTPDLLVHEALQSGLKTANWFIGYDLVFYPHNYRGNHWILVILHTKKQQVDILDSMNTCYKHDSHVVKDILLVVSLHFFTAFGRKMAFSTWNICSLPCPQQVDVHNCGIYVLYFASCVANYKPIRSLSRISLKRYRYLILEKFYEIHRDSRKN